MGKSVFDTQCIFQRIAIEIFEGVVDGVKLISSSNTSSYVIGREVGSEI